MIGRMGMAGDNDPAGSQLAELLKAAVRGIGKEQLPWMVGAAMKETDTNSP